MPGFLRLLVVIFVVALLPYNSSQAAQAFSRSQAFGDWVLNCTKDNDPNVKSTERCSLQQKLITDKGDRLVVINIIKIPDVKEKLALFTLPLGFYIPDGVEITIDSGKPRRLLIAYCVQVGCVAQISLEKKLFKQMSAGKKLKVRLVTHNRAKKLEFIMSLKGISAGIKAVN
ncbi:MAG: invasion associated locus B family protein [Magnetococcales bacterium]|nr:invasion associated locus B family protein [Magnetococcales bacterium]MBF0359305.1 invasion associated locus B family protein [Magnetococcales bacterium]